jgi:hypothetical protein
MNRFLFTKEEAFLLLLALENLPEAESSEELQTHESCLEKLQAASPASPFLSATMSRHRRLQTL